MVNFEVGNEMWKMNYSTWHKRGTKKISVSPTGIEPTTSRTKGGRAIHWATRTHTTRSFNWVHMRQASCILLGSALSNSSWVVINEFWWWILSSERWIIQHDTSVGQRKYMSPRKESSPWPLEYMAGALSTLSYENLWRARSFNWVHTWQERWILLGSAPSNSSWVVISEFWWWILSSVMKCERWIMQHDTSVRSFTYILVSRIKLRAEVEGKSLLAYSGCCCFFVPNCPFGFQLHNKSIGCLFISDNIDWPQVK